MKKSVIIDKKGTLQRHSIRIKIIKEGAFG